jgi:hypothetical protein
VPFKILPMVMIIKTGLCEPCEGLLVIVTTRVMDIDHLTFWLNGMEYNNVFCVFSCPNCWNCTQYIVNLLRFLPFLLSKYDLFEEKNRSCLFIA